MNLSCQGQFKGENSIFAASCLEVTAALYVAFAARRSQFDAPTAINDPIHALSQTAPVCFRSEKIFIDPSMINDYGAIWKLAAPAGLSFLSQLTDGKVMKEPTGCRRGCRCQSKKGEPAAPPFL
jgi:hypothetical protein